MSKDIVGAIVWTQKRKGSGIIYMAPGIARAVVDNRGLGFNPGIFWNGRKFESVKAAQAAAEASKEADHD